MNASDFSSLRKGAVFDTHNPAGGIPVMGETTLFFGRLAMTSTSEQRTFATNKRGALFSLCLLGRNPSGAVKANLLPRFRGTNVLAEPHQKLAMPFGQMFALRKAFKVVGAVVGFITVNVVDLFAWLKIGEPACRYNAVHKPSPETQVPLLVNGWGTREQLSDNFSAARSRVKMVKESVLGSFYRDANHVVPSFGGYGIFILTHY
jgi:hypothetical protein